MCALGVQAGERERHKADVDDKDDDMRQEEQVCLSFFFFSPFSKSFQH